MYTHLFMLDTIHKTFIYGCRDAEDAKESINSMPDVYRYGINQLEKMLQPLVAKGLQSVLLFGVTQYLEKVTFIKHIVFFLNCTEYHKSQIIL